MDPLNPQTIVEAHYTNLFRFALSLSRDQSAAWDLTQQTFYLWTKKGHQLREPGKVKSWLFTTLYHEFLATRRRERHFISEEMNDNEHAAPQSAPDALHPFDGDAVYKALGQLKDEYCAALTLFYLKSNSYKEIAEILDIPIGTVMSRISRGKADMRKLLSDPMPHAERPAESEDQP